jgi:hypothetical protein
MIRVARAVTALGFIVASAVTAIAATATPASAATATAVVVIDTGTNVRSAVIHFDGTVTGIEALQLAGANPVTYGYAGQGAAVCELDGVGNPPSSCLVGPNSEYWAYYVSRDGATGWTYARGCACTTTVGDGAVEGWRYGTGAAPRASASFCAYVSCPAPAPPTSPSGGGGGSGGDAGGGSGGSGGAGTAGADPASASGPSGSATGPSGGAAGGDGSGVAPPGASTDAPPAADTVTSTTSASTTTTTRADDGDRRLAALARQGGGGDSSGSPLGVALAAGALGATVAGAVALRRRRIRSTPG